VQPVLKLLRPSEWADFQASGQFAGSPDDLRDGFIHLSTPAQAIATAQKHFANVPGLIALTLDADALVPLRWEPSRSGQLFPHLYRPLVLADVRAAAPFTP
jgi:uncharacterized protein (DUF952 family)